MKKLTLLALLLSTTALYAQDKKPEITIYGSSHVGVEAPRVGASVSLITADEMEERGIKTLQEALRSLPSVQALNSGGVSQIRIRGTEGKNALIIVDGVIYNNVGDGEAFVDNFPTGDIERIEVVRGPQSGIYGAQANGGAIIISTKTGKGFKRPEVEANVEYGSLNTKRISLSARGSKGDLYNAMTIQGHKTDGYNTALNGSEKDGSDSFTFTNKFGGKITENLSFETFIRHQQRHYKYDLEGFDAVNYYAFLEDSDASARVNSTLARLSATYKALEGKWVHNVAVDINKEDARHMQYGFFAYANQGQRLGATYKNAYSFDGFGAKNTLITGLETKSETFKYKDNFGTWGAGSEWLEGKTRNRQSVFTELLSDFKQGTTISGALRYDINSQFANILTYRLTASHAFSATSRLHSSYGKGSTNPTFFQQYGYQPSNFVGNSAIKPVQSTGFDIGFEQKWFGGKLITDLTLFAIQLKDAIEGAPAIGGMQTVVNSSQSLSRNGAEFSSSLLVSNWLTLNGSYGYFEGKDSTGLTPVYRPNHTYSLGASARMLQNKGLLTVSLNHNGKMRDLIFGGFAYYERSNINAFSLLNAQFSYEVSKNTTAYIRGENLLNTKYEESVSYRGTPMQIYGGVKIKIQ